MIIVRTNAGGLALGLLLAVALSAGEAWAGGPQPYDIRADSLQGGSNTLGAGSATLTDIVGKGRGLGRGTIDASLSVGPGVVTNAGTSEPCSSAAGSISFLRSTGDTMALATNGMLCEMGLAVTGSILAPNAVYNGGVSVDAAGSTGRFDDARGTGSIQVNWDGTGEATVHSHGLLSR